MSLFKFFADATSQSVIETVYEAYVNIASRVGPLRASGPVIWDSNWDLYIILDAARIDAVKYVADEQDLNYEINTQRSSGASSIDWMNTNFSDKYAEQMSDTLYITANPFVTEHGHYNLDVVDLSAEYDTSVPKVPDEYVTERAIREARTTNYEKYIVHYLSPHFPILEYNWPEAEAVTPEERWAALRKDEHNRFRVITAYLTGLRHVLEEVERLRMNFGGNKGIISADHGEALGEFGLWHHSNFPVRSAIDVPVINVNLSDTENVEGISAASSNSEATVNDRLESLGYL